MTLDHLREIALIQISQAQRTNAMTVNPEFKAQVHADYAAAERVTIEGVPAWDKDTEQRFHLWFAYPSGAGFSWGDEAFTFSSIERAAYRLARARGVKEIYIRKRYHHGRPTSEATPIEKVFVIA